MGRAPTRQGAGRHAHPQGRDPVPGRRSPARPPRRNPGAPPLRRRPAPARGAERQPDSQARDPVFRGQGVVFRARVRRAWRGAGTASDAYLARRTMAPLLDVLEEMDMLTRLHRDGLLSDHEYASKRTLVLERL